VRRTALVRTKVALLAVASQAGCTGPNPAYHPQAPEPDAASAADVAAPVLAPDTAAPAPDLAPPAPDAAPPDAPAGGPTGLLAHWRLDEPAGLAVLDDTGANPGVLHNGVARVASGFPAAHFPNAGAASFDGVDDYVDLGVATLPPMQAAKSVSLWCQPRTEVTMGRRNLLVFNNRTEEESLQLGLERGYPAVWRWGTDPAIIIAQDLLDTGWHHLVYAYDGAVQRLYVDGVVAGTVDEAPPTAPVTSAHLGTYDPVDDRTELWSGLIDDVRIYDHALGPAEIAWLAAGRD